MTDLAAIAALPERIAVKLRPDGDCWTWTGNVAGRYGHVRDQGRTYQVHRLVYSLLVGPIPDGLTLDHLCRNRLCVNPAHLEPVSNRENTLRGFGPTATNARATHCKHGHAFDEVNTRYRQNGWRACRKCQADLTREIRHAHRS